ncbi:MAG: glycosyltransferase family 1 protein [Chloroflexi bacterium HGW-Chloroflexi-1]|nr:MAG: glycosyltransferase family 1 protein [Chloroflexi bacterium HGW-Chloroflexi-1]
MLIGIDASRATLAHRTGTETYSLRLIEALLRLDSGHRFRLYTNGTPPAGLFWDDVAPSGGEVRSIPFPRLWTHLRLSAEMLRYPPDVLFVPAHVLPLIHPRRSVATVHDVGYLFYPEAHHPADRRYLDWSTGWNARRSAAVLADSAATKADLVRAYGVDPGGVHVVYLGRDAALAPVRDADALARVRARYGIGERYLLYVGTLQPRKNLARLVDAFAPLAGDPALDGVQLVLAGKRGWLDDDLAPRVARLGLSERVRFPGYVADADLPALLSGARAFVFPSLYEGFGIPVLEAQSCGVPVMTSNNSSLPEVAGDAALLVDPHDVDAIAEAMCRLVTDDALRAELVRRGFENVKRFSWEKCARETLEVLEGVSRQVDR